MGFEDFDGFPELIDTLRTLCRRTRDESPPIVGCVQPSLDADPGLLESVAARLRSGDRKVHLPHALVPLTRDASRDPADTRLTPITADDVVAVRGVLLEVADQLARDPAAYRFPRFWLVAWLMTQTFDDAPTTVVRVRELRRRLRHRSIIPLTVDDAAVADGLPWWVRLSGVLATPLYFRIRQSGRVPGFGRRYRWFLRRQPNLAPGLYTSFFGLAERLTAGQWETEDPEQVLRLLVNAFLGDLREAFRGAGWVRRYRTTFPVVLLDGITRTNGGYALVRTVSAIRNDTGLFDPMLLVTTSTRVPPLAMQPLPAQGSLKPATAVASAVTGWQQRLPGERRKRDVVAWLIPVHVPERATGAALPAVREKVAALPALEPPKRHWLRTRAAAITVVGVLVLGSVGAYAGFGLAHSRATCGDGFTWAGIEPLASEVTRADDGCVGVTDGSNPLVLPDGAVFDEVRTRILEQNREAAARHAAQPERPFVTLVFLGSLTAPATAGDDALTAEREQLAGVAVAQKVQLTKPDQPYEPLVRVLIANAGPGMQHGLTVAQQLGRMAAADPSIVAVVGLSESRAATQATIRELAAVGLPTISATLSADSLVDASRMYYQIAPQNRRQARVAAAYVNELLTTGQMPAGRPLTRAARIYLSDDTGDIYSTNLAAGFADSFRGRGFAVETVAFAPRGVAPGGAPADRRLADAGLAGRDACDFDGVVLYAARGLPEFQAFVDGVGDRCRDRPPYVLAGDDVTRYVADRDVSRANRSVPFHYLSFALSPEVQATVPNEASDFYSRLDELFPYEQTNRGRSLDGHAALNYDAAYTALVAVSYLARDGVAINGGTLWPALSSLTDAADAQRSLRGVTGEIDFGGAVAQRVPVDKPVAVVTFSGGDPLAEQNIVCGARDDESTQPWCPFDR